MRHETLAEAEMKRMDTLFDPRNFAAMHSLLRCSLETLVGHDEISLDPASSKRPTYQNNCIRASLICQNGACTIEPLKRALQRRGYKLEYQLTHSSVVMNHKGKRMLTSIPTVSVTLPNITSLETNKLVTALTRSIDAVKALSVSPMF